ncbi:UDP-N-acetylglucosamine 1-carboxyvinyltransferase [Alkalithermobacter thermoalcaliphilus JW-YL-7 = DSM 7308]|uniref:UDP-N-acetylglucosamine 1-carboxyvinyltransferase n=1 Tax=Alkalithermobacter thermoalcaliphilus JW-YL-7 = DSM 7308 TaxID=1121328 RepID=A0A150FPL0_CLOPD|nr:UDP-N-acetylglucosamine 1-carboxyvinyltransferase [[Clostridium] paradoxum JW-YL-7 = DSM 7308]SHK98427.1 UDP-N-acetylglucosamine 1-carboxyvinyltransferase [[Clostridium] paradoxum JW-YL-7 = DSM 7308]
MDKFIIRGGNKLKGEISLKGAKNAVLPIVAATILNEGESIIHNVPNIADVNVMIDILRHVGCYVKFEDGTLTINTKYMHTSEIPESFVRRMRSSIILLGSMVARFDQTKISYPGGCEIGSRPIDLHLKSLSQMGVEIQEVHGYIRCKRQSINSSEIQLDFPSVGATENIMLASVKSRGITKIYNAAKEPEIVDLQNFLNSMGAKVKGAGTSYIEIEGVERLNNVEYTIIPDRIAIGTYLVAAAMTNGEIIINNVVPEHIQSIVSKLKEAGCEISYLRNSIKLKCLGRINSVEHIKTLPYPGFPTDMQAQITTLMTIANGTSLIEENIFENRFKYCNELIRMGANITISGKTAIVKGVKSLMGAKVNSPDLRGGAALVLAALNANGYSEVYGIDHIDRGYESMEKVLSSLGADIIRA